MYDEHVEVALERAKNPKWIYQYDIDGSEERTDLNIIVHAILSLGMKFSDLRKAAEEYKTKKGI